MALGFNFDTSGSGQKFLPVVSYDARSGDMTITNREPQSDGTWEKVEVEVKYPTHAICDLANIEIGWSAFADGKYNSVYAKAGGKTPARPTAEHKQAIRLRMFFKEHGLREFKSSSVSVLRVIDAIHTQALDQQAANPGKMPVVAITGTESIKIQTKQGEAKFKIPVMEIVKWVESPPELKEAAAEPEPAKAASAAKPVAELDDDF
jgi:hypothetical protein